MEAIIYLLRPSDTGQHAEVTGEILKQTTSAVTLKVIHTRQLSGHDLFTPGESVIIPLSNILYMIEIPESLVAGQEES